MQQQIANAAKRISIPKPNNAQAKRLTQPPQQSPTQQPSQQQTSQPAKVAQPTRPSTPAQQQSPSKASAQPRPQSPRPQPQSPRPQSPRVASPVQEQPTKQAEPTTAPEEKPPSSPPLVSGSPIIKRAEVPKETKPPVEGSQTKNVQINRSATTSVPKPSQGSQPGQAQEQFRSVAAKRNTIVQTGKENERERRIAIQEFIKSERFYCRDLEVWMG